MLVQRQNGTRSFLPTDRADRFQVYSTHQVAIAEGDRLRITQNGQLKPEAKGKAPRVSRSSQQPVRVNNGDVFTVEGFTSSGDMKLSNGLVLPKNYGHFNLGYVDTSYASQGKTVDRVFIATGNESLAAANQQQWYVSVSRGRESAKVYVDSKDDMRDAIQKSGARLAAVELVKDSKPVRPSLHKLLLERSRIARFLKNRVDAVADSWRSRVIRGRQQRGVHYV